MPRPHAGISGIAVTFAALGAWVVYAAVRDTDPVTGLGALLAGNQPESRTPGGPKTTGSDVDPGASGFAVVSGGAANLPIEATTVVGGIRVAKDIAPDIKRLLAAAKTAGFKNVGGGGWRSIDQQRALRKLHGYTSDTQASGSGGRTPTAIPGTSRHEQGHAIDFTINGRSLARQDPFYQWLTVNAGTYGLHPLPSEAWHWSTDGH